jgi:hypothetical protein
MRLYNDVINKLIHQQQFDQTKMGDQISEKTKIGGLKS